MTVRELLAEAKAARTKAELHRDAAKQALIAHVADDEASTHAVLAVEARLEELVAWMRVLSG